VLQNLLVQLFLLEICCFIEQSYVWITEMCLVLFIRCIGWLGVLYFSYVGVRVVVVITTENLKVLVILVSFFKFRLTVCDYRKCS